MGKCKKTAQETFFDGKITPIPAFKLTVRKRSLEDGNQVATSSTTTSKRPRLEAISNLDLYIQNFYQSMRTTLKDKISSIISKNKNVEKRTSLLNNLKDKSSNEAKLPRGIITLAACLSDCKPSYLSQYLDQHLDKRIILQVIQHLQILQHVNQCNHRPQSLLLLKEKKNILELFRQVLNVF